jgi:DNA/RNA-binding protein KIN17
MIIYNRDENAFKQHSLSESHVRQMLVVGEHANTYIETYSQEFLKDFLQLLSRRWGTKRVRANQVYQEFIQDKHHTHMNSTKWVTLTGFLQYLGKSGICHVDETEKGWFISWIDNSPKALAKQDAALKKERQDLGDEERQRRMINEQIGRVKAMEAEQRQNSERGSSAGPSTTDDEGEDEEIDITTIQPIKLSIGAGLNNKGKQREESHEPQATDSKSADAGLGADKTPIEGEEIKNVAPEDAKAPQAILVSAEPVAAPSASLLSKPKVNPLKMVGKSNPLKANPLKAKSKAETSAPPSQATNNANGKRTLTAMEAIALEEQERKRRRERSNHSGPGRDSLHHRH